MSWRVSPLPADWPERRAYVLRRDRCMCQWLMPSGHICGQYADQVDHIGSHDYHGYDNLRALCRWHHARRTSAQGNAARRRLTQRHKPEPHPGVTE